MGLFGKKVHVTVHGYTSKGGGADGRYERQARLNRKTERSKIRSLALVPRTPEELCAYIETTYGVAPLPHDDEIYLEVAEKLADWEPLDLNV